MMSKIQKVSKETIWRKEKAMALFSSDRLGSERLEDGRIRFTVWAPFADRVFVETLSPEKRIFPLTPLGNGYHRDMVPAMVDPVTYHYRLHKKSPDGKEYREQWPDPASRFQPEGVHGPSQLVEDLPPRRDDAWAGIPLSKYIISEIHVGTFTPEGTFDAVIPLLDRLKETGFTAIELMPVAQFPGSRNWGYDGVYPFSVQNTYGGPNGLKRLIDACHRRQMAVVLDVVYNHLGPEGNYLSKFGPYFTDRYRTPWGDAVNFDGPDSDPVRRFFLENALQWVTEYGCDALRIDAVHAIYDSSARPFLEELAMVVSETAEIQNRRIYVIAESALNDSRTIRSRDRDGLGLDAQWNDDFHHALHALLTGERTGYYQDFGRVAHLARAWREGFVYSGQYSRYRRRRHGNSSRNLSAGRLVVFAQNHDQVGNRMRGDRFSTVLPLEKQKLAAAQVLLSPFIPLLFMGEEYGETAPFPYFVSHTDPALVDAVREGRRNEFKGFEWKGEPPDPQAEETFQTAKLNPSRAASEPHRTLLAFHRELIRLRKRHPCLMQLSKKSMRVRVLGSVLEIHRFSFDDEGLLLFHFGDTSVRVTVSLPPGEWTKILDSRDRRWLGPGSLTPEKLILKRDAENEVPLGPWSAVLFYRDARRASC